MMIDDTKALREVAEQVRDGGLWLEAIVIEAVAYRMEEFMKRLEEALGIMVTA